jgi:hypothetical protein
MTVCFSARNNETFYTVFHLARVAITGRNPNFGSKLYAIRPHILVLNKKDLVDMERYK